MILAPTHRDALNEFMLPNEMKAGYGTEMRAVWETPQLTELMRQELVLKEAATGVFTEEQTERLTVMGEEAVVARDDLALRMQQAETDEERDGIYQEYIEHRAEHVRRTEVVKQEAVDAGTLLEVETLRATYGDLLEFNERMPAAEAAELYRLKIEDTIRSQVLSRSEGGFIRGVSRFGVSMLSVVLDPTEAAISIGTALIMPWTGGSLGWRVAAGAGEAFVGASIAEAAVYGLSQRQQYDYTAKDALFNVAVGTVLGGVFNAAIGSRVGLGAPDEPVRIRRNAVIEPTSRQVDLVQTAIRLVIADEPVTFNPFAGDRRAGISLARVERVGVQIMADAVPTAPVTALARGADGTPLTFGRRADAEARAASTGGVVARSTTPLEGGLRKVEYTVREPIKGEFARDARGNPIMFPTRKEADEWVTKARSTLESLAPRAGAENLRPTYVKSQGYAVTYGMDTAGIRALRRGDAEIPEGVNLDEISIDDGTGKILKGDAAYEKVAERYAGELGASHPARTDIDGASRWTDDAEEAAEEIDMLAKTLEKDEVEAIEDLARQYDADADSVLKAIEDTTACLMKSIV